MKIALSALLLALWAVAAVASYPVEVEPEMNGLAIKVLTSSGSPLVITFVSEEKTDATCKVYLASGFDTPQERTVTARAGKSTAIPITLISAPNRVRVKATCVATARKQP